MIAFDYIGRALRLRRLLVIEGNADDHIAIAALQRVAHESHPLRQPRVGNTRIEIARDQVSDLVLEPLLLRVGEGEVVGIGADAEKRVMRNE